MKTAGRALIGEHRGKFQIGQQRKRRRGQSKSEEVAPAGQGATRILGVIAEIQEVVSRVPLFVILLDLTTS